MCDQREHIVTAFSLRNLGIGPGQAKHADVFIDLPPYVQAGVEYVPTGGGVDASLDISEMIEGTAYHLSFAADYVGPCARCLEPATFHAHVDAYQVHDPREEDEELRSEHIDDVEQELDLTAWAREEVGLIFPTKVLCRPDCPGLETTYADPPSEDEVDADGKPIDPRWAALKALQETSDTDA
jgi:uncharacterized protein